ncbi:MAG TPA: PilZ domain-containing protein, partial [Candidatus Acidoferrum sp.]|nr:PilZ domain-containing protein [Candidatus Acidoferrum sp.]
MQQRQHARVRLRLPVRLRWVAPLGQQAEICETRNVSRGGLLLACRNHHAEGFPLWVTFPFDAGNPEAQPEMLARVVRTKVAAAGSAGGEEIAVHFEGTGRPTTAHKGQILNVPAKNGTTRAI